MRTGVRPGMCVVCGALSWLVMTVCVLAAPVKIVSPAGPVAPYKLVELQAEGDLTGAAVLWDVTPEDAVDMREQPGGKLTFVAPPGTYKVRCTVIRLKDGQTIADRQRCVVVIGVPTPVPPIPPGPNPPTPPGPVPIPNAGFRVLIIEDAVTRGKLPPQQLSVLFDKSVRDYLDRKCVKSEQSNEPDWAIWDSGVDGSARSKVLAEAMKRQPSRDKLPWVIISDGKVGFEGPLPKDVDATLELLKKYGGS